MMQELNAKIKVNGRQDPNSRAKPSTSNGMSRGAIFCTLFLFRILMYYLFVLVEISF